MIKEEEKKLAKAASKEVSTVLQVQGELPASVGDAIDMSHNRLAISQNCRTVSTFSLHSISHYLI